MQQPDAHKLEPGSSSVSAGTDTTPTAQRDTDVLQPDLSISCTGASADFFLFEQLNPVGVYHHILAGAAKCDENGKNG